MKIIDLPVGPNRQTHFLHWSLIEKGQQNRIELVTTPATSEFYRRLLADTLVEGYSRDTDQDRRTLLLLAGAAGTVTYSVDLPFRYRKKNYEQVKPGFTNQTIGARFSQKKWNVLKRIQIYSKVQKINFFKKSKQKFWISTKNISKFDFLKNSENYRSFLRISK